jgi:hypothetical protein
LVLLFSLMSGCLLIIQLSCCAFWSVCMSLHCRVFCLILLLDLSTSLLVYNLCHTMALIAVFVCTFRYVTTCIQYLCHEKSQSRINYCSSIGIGWSLLSMLHIISFTWSLAIQHIWAVVFVSSLLLLCFWIYSACLRFWLHEWCYNEDFTTKYFFHVCHMKVGPESYNTGGTLGQSTLKDMDECLKVRNICLWNWRC